MNIKLFENEIGDSENENFEMKVFLNWNENFLIRKWWTELNELTKFVIYKPHILTRLSRLKLDINELIQDVGQWRHLAGSHSFIHSFRVYIVARLFIWL